MADAEAIGLDSDELPKARDAVSYIADPRLLGRIAELERISGNLVREPHLPIRAGELPSHVDPADWRAGYLMVHDYEPYPDIYGALRELAPQALLRDLFRPERENYFPAFEDRLEIDWGGTAALRDAVAAQFREPLTPYQPLRGALLERLEEWRSIVRGPWKPILDDNAPRKSVPVVRDPTLLW